MIKNYFIQLADYNIRANDIVHSWFEKITDEQWKKPLVSSFNSIEATALHTAGAETIWCDRLNKAVAPLWMPDTFKGSKKDVADVWSKASQNLKLFIENFDETKMGTHLSFTRVNGVTYELPHFVVLAHVFNHSTYHRGQIVTLLRQVGFTEVTSTDLSGLFRK
ncbi:MAG: DinB family protein [Bacteroidota bacterium]|nr:DinB family protein [Bacteroidota bacterium]